MNDNEPKPPAEETDVFTLLLQIAAAVAISYYCWQPLYDVISPIFEATLRPALQAMGL